MDTENIPGLTAPGQFLEGHNFAERRGNCQPRGFPTKDCPYCKRSGKFGFNNVRIPVRPSTDFRLDLPYGFERCIDCDLMASDDGCGLIDLHSRPCLDLLRRS